MRRQFRLSRQLGARQLELFSFPNLLRIDDRGRVGAAPIGFALFHPFLDPRFGVYQAFSRISHPSRIM